jgi:multidrug efflux system membrane fusion protein
MSRHFLFPRLLFATALLGLASESFSRGDEPSAVAVSRPVEREVAETAEFTGRLEAASTVELHARVTGYLVKVHFKAGTQVKKGQLLLEIDPRIYKAMLNKAEAELAVAVAVLKRRQVELARARKLIASKAISQEDFDNIVAAQAEAEVAIKPAQASVEYARLHLDFTQVRAPIDGTIGRPVLTPGNLVQADTMTLATIVQTDPIYVHFNVDERTLLRLRRLGAAGKIKPDSLPLFMGLTDEKGYPHKGIVDSFDNRVDPNTGTISARGRFSNANGLFVPGLFARVRMPLAVKRKMLLVSEEAILNDMGQRYLLIVNDKNVVERRAVTVAGQLGKMRAIEAGLKPEEWVVVRGLKGLRLGVKIKPRRVAMPGSEDR